MPQSVAGISQQGQTQGTFDMQVQPGQSYVDMLNKGFLIFSCFFVFPKKKIA